ncbi:hypothetical protein FNV43_RR09186 [Rhamnella rubrinervis]|uniref:Molybdenum cofactor sulfurase n=1 Tax=Rhamnella rubrinervis TaxID=2594499 RepID=A0A8K0HAC2_9ROSA|nr:hypothetical protein FNV43_RR09186 [Rhamnella rubrinervis]
MQSPCIREASQACLHGCCATPPSLAEANNNPLSPDSTRSVSATASHYHFALATASTLHPNAQFTNHESLPSLHESFSNFIRAFPQYSQTNQADQIRSQQYYHLTISNHVCLDYAGHGLFSYSQQQRHCCSTASVASSSSYPPPPLHSPEPYFFDVSYKSVNLKAQLLHGGQDLELEVKVKRRIMDFMNVVEDDYTMVFAANQSSAMKLLADSYPFQSNRNLLTVYDHKNEAVELMTESSRKRGARVMSAEYSWPNMRIQSRKLRKMVVSKRNLRTKGLFVFPLQSRMTGARYSYQWMSIARENGWHVLLDACALGAKDMETLGLSLFRPDFLICSFFKVFGENPSGFGCLFVKKTVISLLADSTSAASSIGIASLVNTASTSHFPQNPTIEDREAEQKSEIESEIVELDIPSESAETKNKEVISTSENSEIEFRGLDHADSLGLILISRRARCLINWLVNALMSLQHPHSENGHPLIRIYGPKIRPDRGPSVAFNVFDWKGEKIDPALVQKLADRYGISLSYGFLQHIRFSDKNEEERETKLETCTAETEDIRVLNKNRDEHCSGISAVTTALGMLTNFEDAYRLWVFVSRFLDADFVEKERWRYLALNQRKIEV